MISFPLEFDQGRRGDGFHLRDDPVRFFRFDDGPERRAVKHVDDMAAVGDMHGGRVGIAVHRNDFDAEALQFDDDFLAELTRAEQQGLPGGGSEGRSDLTHDYLIE